MYQVIFEANVYTSCRVRCAKNLQYKRSLRRCEVRLFLIFELSFTLFATKNDGEKKNE